MATEPPQRSVDAGRVLGRGFEALKANFLPFFGFALLLSGVPGFLNTWFTAAAAERLDAAVFASSSYWLTLGATLAGSFLGGALLQGVLTRSTILQLGGRPPDIAGSALLGLRLLLPIVGISICVGFLIVGGFILLVVPAIIVWCAFSVSVPALVEEQGGVFASMGRSRALTRGARLQIFLLGVLFWIFALVIGGVASVVTGVSVSATPGRIMPDPLIAGLGNGLAASLTNLIGTVVIAALYVELREVREGASTSDLAQVFG
jgi:hypothetical protein